MQPLSETNATETPVDHKAVNQVQTPKDDPKSHRK